MSVDAALAACAETLKNAQRVLLTSHRRPDGDGTGSMVALAVMLRAAGKQVTLYSPDLAPRRYQWLAAIPTWTQRIADGARFDCTVVVDCADEALLAGSLPTRDVCGVLISIITPAAIRSAI